MKSNELCNSFILLSLFTKQLYMLHDLLLHPKDKIMMKICTIYLYLVIIFYATILTLCLFYPNKLDDPKGEIIELASYLGFHICLFLFTHKVKLKSRWQRYEYERRQVCRISLQMAYEMESQILHDQLNGKHYDESR